MEDNRIALSFKLDVDTEMLEQKLSRINDQLDQILAKYGLLNGQEKEES